MADLGRRGLLTGLGAMLAAPAIVRTRGLLMPIRPQRGWVLSNDVWWLHDRGGLFQWSACSDPAQWDNRITAASDLSEASLEQMIIEIQKAGRQIAYGKTFIIGVGRPDLLPDKDGMPLFAASHPENSHG
jgi:hypothetical protein